MIELKKCPFCGSEAEVFEDITFECETGKQIGKIKVFAWCTNCSALVSGDSKAEATEAWNRRAGDGT